MSGAASEARARVAAAINGADNWGACSHEWARIDDMKALVAALDLALAQRDDARRGEDAWVKNYDQEREWRWAAEAALERVRKVADDWASRGPFEVVYETPGELAQVIRAALDGTDDRTAS